MPLRVTTSLSLAIETLSQTAGKLQHLFRTCAGSLHERASDDHSVGQLPDRARLCRSGDAEADANRKLGRRAQPLDHSRQARGCRFLDARHAKPADKINESASVPGYLRHSV